MPPSNVGKADDIDIAEVPAVNVKFVDVVNVTALDNVTVLPFNEIDLIVTALDDNVPAVIA